MGIAGEFKKFILRGNVVDLAVGLVVGTAFGAIVASLVRDIFMPVVGLLTGGFDISNIRVGYKDAQIGIGLFFQTVINFVIIGGCMFAVVKGMNFLKRKEDAAPTAPPTPSEALLAEIRDLLKARAGNDQSPPAAAGGLPAATSSASPGRSPA